MPFLSLGRPFLLLLAGITAFGGWLLLSGTDRFPPFDLGEPVGVTTRYRLSALSEEPTACRALLDRAGVAYRALAPRTTPAECATADTVAWARGGAREAGYAPATPALACPLAAGLALWEWDVVQPAAFALLGSEVVRIDHFGSFACRRVYGRATGSWSQHARARAIDVAGFRLADGRRITVAADWAGDSPEARFLHRVRDGACRVFGTTLSPDYNAAHRDHLHLDEARSGWSVCR